MIIERTFIAVDDCGNQSAPCVQEITLVDDEGPTMVCPAPVNVTCVEDIPDPFTSYNEFIAAGGSVMDCEVDESSFALQLDSVVANGSGCLEYLRRYSIADICGNVSTCDMTIIVTDDIPPSFNYIPPNIVIGCDSCIQSFLNGGFEQPRLGSAPSPRRGWKW